MSEGSKTTWPGVTWVVVTGASRGLGAAICEGVAGMVAAGSRIVGVARSQQGLDTTSSNVHKANPDVKFTSVVMDLGTASKENLEKALDKLLIVGQDPPPTRCVIFHNAGSLGDLVYLRNLKDLDHVNSYFQMNVSSVVMLNAVVIEIMSKQPNVALEIVNISSLCAVQPFKSWGLYCAGKAARDMLFKVLADEEPNILVLNYAPGPLDNEMQEIARRATTDKELRSTFASLKEEGKLLPCNVSANKLLDILKQRKFKSGDHVDYYDV
ncbi:sepiapterin reductase [Procambarus clarkii]|nr:sepiapterin reductase-like [Procambarus clarkii]XP_045616528.1 sepiapterin reductase-like [Procambarus clarkii]